MEKTGVRGLIARGGYDLQERPAELNLTGVMVTSVPGPVLTSPSPGPLSPLCLLGGSRYGAAGMSSATRLSQTLKSWTCAPAILHLNRPVSSMS